MELLLLPNYEGLTFELLSQLGYREAVMVSSRLSKGLTARCQTNKQIEGLMRRREFEEFCRLFPADRLENAAVRGLIRVLQTLIDELKPGSDKYDLSVIINASWQGHLTVVDLILNDQRFKSKHLNGDGKVFQMALRLAVGNGQFEVVKRLLADPRADPTFNDNILITKACNVGSLPIVELLLADPRVDPLAQNNGAAMTACEKGHLEVLKRLLADSRVSSTFDYFSGFIKACENHQVEIADYLSTDETAKPTSRTNIIIKAMVSRSVNRDVVIQLCKYPKFDPSANINDPVQRFIFVDRSDISEG